MKNISFRSQRGKSSSKRTKKENRQKYIIEDQKLSHRHLTHTHTYTHIFHSNLQSTFIKLTFRSKFDGTRARNPNSHRGEERQERGREACFKFLEWRATRPQEQPCRPQERHRGVDNLIRFHLRLVQLRQLLTPSHCTQPRASLFPSTASRCSMMRTKKKK